MATRDAFPQPAATIRPSDIISSEFLEALKPMIDDSRMGRDIAQNLHGQEQAPLDDVFMTEYLYMLQSLTREWQRTAMHYQRMFLELQRNIFEAPQEVRDKLHEPKLERLRVSAKEAAAVARTIGAEYEAPMLRYRGTRTAAQPIGDDTPDGDRSHIPARSRPREQKTERNAVTKRLRLDKREPLNTRTLDWVMNRKSQAGVSSLASEFSRAGLDQGQSALNHNTTNSKQQGAASQERSAPVIEYEDLTGEVEARLKAKEEKKAAEKNNRKRKRNSGDSVDVESKRYRTSWKSTNEADIIDVG